MDVPENLAELYEFQEDSTVSKYSKQMRIDCFQLANANKQLRHLENTDMHLESIDIRPFEVAPLTDVPPLNEVLGRFARKVPMEALNNPKDIHSLLESVGKADNIHIQHIHQSVEASGVTGRSVEELVVCSAAQSSHQNYKGHVL